MAPEEARSRLDALLGKMADAAAEQESSRFLQWRLLEEVGSEGECDEICTAVLPSVGRLASDVFGNFVVQKLFERGTPEQRRGIVDKLLGEIYNLATNKYGCRVVQKMLEVLPSEDQARLVKELHNKVLDCVEDMHGNHVIQIMVKSMAVADIEFIINTLAGSAEKMASHMYGCRVIQRLVEKCTPDQISELITKLRGKVDKLATDLHGNYVVQCILEFGSQEEKRSIIQLIRKDIVFYGKNKVGSNVVEKCFEVTTDGDDAGFLSEEREALYRTVLGEAGDSNTPLKTLANDKFGNYAVQGIIRHSRGADRDLLKQRLNSMEGHLNHQTSKHIMNALKKLE